MLSLIPLLLLNQLGRADGVIEAEVPQITVMGAAPKSSSLDMVSTVEELSGTKLQRKKASTIGETLAHETGVSSSYFGPNASRPIIRGLDGDRLRVLQNGTGVLDASAASQDHAVAVDPIAVDRIEIVRGPAALLYGSQAVGGVVNMVTNRILEQTPKTANGRATTRFGSNDLERALGAAVDTPAGSHWAIHADGSARGADDYYVNGFPSTAAQRSLDQSNPETAGEPVAHDRVLNSYNHSDSEALGASYVYDRGFIGTSFSNYDSIYGTVAERYVHINMHQQRWDLGGEARDLGFFKSVRVKNTFSHYKHDEIDHGQTASTFKNDGDEARVDLRHRPVLGYSGVFGAQANMFDFSALGDDNLVPKTHNADYSIFAFEEKDDGMLKPSFGVRLDTATIKSDTEAKFGAGETKAFSGASVSLGLQYQFATHDAAVLNGAYTERAPNYEELFANGPHDATAQFEVGDRALKKERSQSIELSWRHREQDAHGSVGVFLQDFKNFISLAPTGATDAGSKLAVYDFKPVSARLYGAEVEYLKEFTSLIPGGVTSFELKLDSVRGLDRDDKSNLPRMTPIRETLDVLYNADRYQADLELQHVERQTLTAPFETSTDDYLMVNLGIEVPYRSVGFSLSSFVRVNNVFDVLARNHTSVLKDVAPLPGRNFIVGLQGKF